MKKILKKIFGRNTIGLYIAFATACYCALPVVLNSIAMLSRKNFLSESTLQLNNYISYAAALLFLILAAFSLSELEDNFLIRLFKVISEIAPAVSILYIGQLVMQHLLNTTKYKAEAMEKNMIIIIITEVVVLFLATYFIYYLVHSLTMGRYCKGYHGAFISLIKRPHFYLGWTVFLLLAVTSPYLFEEFLKLIKPNIPLSVYTRIMLALSEAFLSATFLTLIFLTMRRNILKRQTNLYDISSYDDATQYDEVQYEQPQYDQTQYDQTQYDQAQYDQTQYEQPQYDEPQYEEPQKKSEGIVAHIFRAAFTLIPVIACIVLIFMYKDDVKGMDSDELAEYDIGTYLSYGSALFMTGNYDEAFQYFDGATDHISAWNYYINQNEDALRKLVLRKPSDVLINQLYVALTGDYATIEHNLIAYSPDSRDLRQVFLSSVKSAKTKDLSKFESAYIDEIITNFAASGKYTSSILDISKISERKLEKISELCDNLAVIKGYRDALEIINGTGKRGAIYNDDVYKISDIADSFPEDSGINYLAAVLGASHASDNASHYARTKTCVLRYIDICENNKELSEEDLYTRKIDAINLLIKTENYSTILEIVDNMDAPTEDDKTQLELVKLFCYDVLHDDDNCYLTAKNLLDTGITSVYYYYGLGALKKGNITETIDALMHLSAKVQDPEITGDELIQTEGCLFVLSEYLSVNDSSTWTGFQYASYNSLSEADKATLSKDTFLNNYIGAIYNYYSSKKYDNALEMITPIATTRTDLPFAQYICGAIKYNKKDFAGAVDCYKLSAAIIPDNAMFWYAMANAYDGMQMYEEAYAASLKAYELVPTVNHEDDWFGIGYHNTRLMNDLKNMVGGDK